MLSARTMTKLEPESPRLITLHDRVMARPLESPPICLRPGDYRSTSRAFFADIPSWKIRMKLVRS